MSKIDVRFFEREINAIREALDDDRHEFKPSSIGSVCAELTSEFIDAGYFERVTVQKWWRSEDLPELYELVIESADLDEEIVTPEAGAQCYDYDWDDEDLDPDSLEEEVKREIAEWELSLIHI